MLDIALGGLDYETWIRGADVICGIRPGYTPEYLGRMPMARYQALCRTVVANQPLVQRAQARVILG